MDGKFLVVIIFELVIFIIQFLFVVDFWILVGDVYLIQYIKILSLLMVCIHLPLVIIALRRKYGTSCLCICFYYYKVFSIVIDNVFQIFSSDTFTIILFWIDFTFTVVGGVQQDVFLERKKKIKKFLNIPLLLPPAQLEKQKI